MQELSSQILIIAYGATGFLSFIAYWPTIADLYFHKKQSANISSYALWSSSTGIAFLYSIVILKDLLLRIVMGINFSACLIILFLSIRLKLKRRN